MAEMTFNTFKGIAAQEIYCQKQKIPNFSPKCGMCFRCNKDIFSEQKGAIENTGISVESASSKHILDCPHCGMSYCN